MIDCDPRLTTLLLVHSFEQVQCHTYTGYCWCVTPDGKPISGSSVQNKTPVCSGTVGRGGRNGKGRRETWLGPQSYRQTFSRVVWETSPGQKVLLYACSVVGSVKSVYQCMFIYFEFLFLVQHSFSKYWL